MSEIPPLVYVVDDDQSVRDALRSLLNSVGLRFKAFSSADDFLKDPKTDDPSCLVLDVRLPWMSGLELQRRLTQAGVDIPVIFITGHGDIPMSVEAMKGGAVEFLTKPFRGQEILDAIHNALAKSREKLEYKAKSVGIHRKLESLTRRERDVLQRVVTGLLNKEIAAELGASERTVKIYRANVMRKMGAESLPELVRMAEKAGL